MALLNLELGQLWVSDVRCLDLALQICRVVMEFTGHVVADGLGEFEVILIFMVRTAL